MILALLFGYSLMELAKWIIIILVVVGVILIVARQAGWQPPAWLWQILGLIALGAVAIIGLRFLLSL